MFEFIPIESQIEKFQDEYYAAIAQCHSAGESTFFIEFMLTQIDRILDELSPQILKDGEQPSQYVEKLLAVMEENVPYTGSALMEKLNLKSRESFRKNYLHPAMERGLIQRTIPEKPNSKNQRYVKG